MLKIIYDLEPFFEDCYRRINVREYAKLTRISPPTASKLLESYYKHSILQKERYRNYIFFYANKTNRQFADLSKIYWCCKLNKLADFLEKNLANPVITLFGSASKAEVTAESDIDLAVFAHKKELDIQKFESGIKRKVQLFWFASFKDIKNKELANNIINGYILKGRLKI